MGFFTSSGRYMSAKSREHSAAVSKETNRSIANNPHVPADARLRAGFRGLGDRWKESRHKSQAAVHKHAAKHTDFKKGIQAFENVSRQESALDEFGKVFEADHIRPVAYGLDTPILPPVQECAFDH